MKNSTVIVGKKTYNLQTENPRRLLDGLQWLNKNEPDTEENVQIATDIVNILNAKHSYNMKANKQNTAISMGRAKSFTLCAKNRSPFKNTAHCILKQDHRGEHFSRYESGNVIYWE